MSRQEAPNGADKLERIKRILLEEDSIPAAPEKNHATSQYEIVEYQSLTKLAQCCGTSRTQMELFIRRYPRNLGVPLRILKDNKERLIFTLEDAEHIKQAWEARNKN